MGRAGRARDWRCGEGKRDGVTPIMKNAKRGISGEGTCKLVLRYEALGLVGSSCILQG